MEASGHPASAGQGYTALRTYRYERKFLVDELRPFQVEALIKLHPYLFYAPYPPRYVNNLYFDTPDLENYYDNLNGASQRRKVRLRWYGAPFGALNSPVLEIKVKDGLVGTKHSYPLPPFYLDQSFCNASFRNLVMNSKLPENVRRDLCSLEIVLFNRYYRRYYASRSGHFRVTLDTEMAFFKANGIFGNTFIHRHVNYHDLVVELKYEIDQEPHANRVAGFFPFRVTRNSKYIQGIEQVYF
ncbi:MAG: VTC domain-containing protein [Anaerolineales bacterium]|nr:VTC domain-containing protein [Anaerolineales bacterium]